MIWIDGFGWNGMALMLFSSLLILALLSVLAWVVLRLVTWETTTLVSPDADTQPPDPPRLTSERTCARLETERTPPPVPDESDPLML